MAIISKVGFLNPIIIDEHDNVIAGNGRLAAAEMLDLTEVPTIQIEHLNDEEKRAGEMSDEQYLRFLAVCIGNMIAASRPGALIYLFIDWRHVLVLLEVCQGHGLELRNICVWNKTTPGQGSFYRSAHELVVVCQIPCGKAINNIELGRHGRNRTNVWSYPGVNTFLNGANDDLSLHPTVIPIAMIAEAIKDASHRGDVVLDPFLGSGTTLLACEKVGRIPA
jgi:DNA modification methylase